MNLAFEKYLFHLGPTVEYGPGVHEKIGELAKGWGCKKALIVTTPQLVEAGVVEKVAASLRSADLEVVVYDGVKTEPTDIFVHEGTEILKSSGADLVIGLGGGGAMDCAKCVAVMAENPGRITDYEGVPATFPNDKKVTLVTMPTTSGSGAEVAGWSVITDSSRSFKMSLSGDQLEPKYVLVDPLLTVDLPRMQTAYSGMDALSQAIESMLSRFRTPLTIALGMHAVRLIAEALPRATIRGWDVEARANMSIGSLFAGITMNTSGAICVHSLAEPMGGIYHKPHGMLVGITLPHVLRFLLPGDHELLGQIAEALGANTEGYTSYEAANLAIERIEELLDELELPTLAEAGLKDEDIPEIARQAMGNASTECTPYPMTQADFETILRRALA